MGSCRGCSLPDDDQGKSGGARWETRSLVLQSAASALLPRAIRQAENAGCASVFGPSKLRSVR